MTSGAVSTGLAAAATVVFGALAWSVRPVRSVLAPGPRSGDVPDRATRPGVRRVGRRRIGRRRRDRAAELLAAVEAMTHDVRSGTTLAVAVERALTQHPDVLAAVHAALVAGTPLREAAAHRSTTSTADERLVLAVLTACAAHGGHDAEALERAAAVLRERTAWRAERRAQSATTALSAVVMTLLPPVVALWSAVTSDDVRRAFASSTGSVIAAAGIALNVVGWWWMRRIVRGATR